MKKIISLFLFLFLHLREISRSRSETLPTFWTCRHLSYPKPVAQ